MVIVIPLLGSKGPNQFREEKGSKKIYLSLALLLHFVFWAIYLILIAFLSLLRTT